MVTGVRPSLGVRSTRGLRMQKLWTDHKQVCALFEFRFRFRDMANFLKLRP